jgi:5-methylcytosine-specific restriction endonuclease McrA
MNEKEKLICPLCNHILYKRYEGMVCKNWKCKLYFKLERGWVLLNKERKNSLTFFRLKYDFDINRFENRKRWLKLKSKQIYQKKKCEICGSNIELHIHHILHRSSNPELTFDEENLIVLCKNCHLKIHKDDKYKFEK